MTVNTANLITAKLTPLLTLVTSLNCRPPLTNFKLISAPQTFFLCRRL